MHTHNIRSAGALYVERLQQAVRVMKGLSEDERSHFDIDLFAIRNKSGVSACIAGFCGFDPWFQAEGFMTTVGDDKSLSRGQVSIPVEIFFGTEEPFYRSGYGPAFRDRPISVDQAIAALNRAIASFDASSNTETPSAGASRAD
ncbi:hypothetical protein GCM10011487_11520 [Steroidobacter agaridevorans]|uniref:Uncharacterized protein n=1 Tax=Steroidobacter agaridevorans TaxID=2695856 RepID=A0A829Y997_9GAMM|nr:MULTISPECIES: hypothetical protein [Steroidobacteraceae]GFE79152.1 hypothetical protein GCM10011487_11520 [Steroidobacter agaridevorans]